MDTPKTGEEALVATLEKQAAERRMKNLRVVVTVEVVETGGLAGDRIWAKKTQVVAPGPAREWDWSETVLEVITDGVAGAASTLVPPVKA